MWIALVIATVVIVILVIAFVVIVTVIPRVGDSCLDCYPDGQFIIAFGTLWLPV